MALARIITRSHQCSRELALDLLARGYTVEIVSPDKIPDNIADLELRVDAGPGDCLTANVEAHNGERSASLEFVHYLKSPMGEFVRRKPEPLDADRLPRESPESFNLEPLLEEPSVVSVVEPESVLKLTPVATTSAEQSASLPAEQLVGSDADASTTLLAPAIAEPIITAEVVSSRHGPRQRYHVAISNSRAILTFAGVVLLVLILGFGVRRTIQASAKGSAAVSAEKITPAPSDTRLNASGAEKDEPKKSAQLVKQRPIAVTEPMAASGKITTQASSASITPAGSRRHDNGVIAHDTVTYLDKSFETHPKKAKPSKHLATKRHNPTKHRSSRTAADTVTYLDSKPAAKSANPN